MLSAADGLLLVMLATMFRTVHDMETKPKADNPKTLRVYALPVGQGDGHMIICPSGRISIVDMGSMYGPHHIQKPHWNADDVKSFMDSRTLPRYRGTWVTRNNRQQRVMQKIKYEDRLYSIVITHNHVDHYKYIPYILPAERIRRSSLQHVYISCNKTVTESQIHSNRLMRTWFQRINDSQITSINGGQPCGLDGTRCEAIELCPSDDGVNATTIAANLAGCGKKVSNADSIVFKLSFGPASIMFTGDFTGAKYQQQLVGELEQSGNQDMRVTIFKLAHHGSGTLDANSASFVNAFSPKAVFLSSDPFYGNYGHPNCSVMDAIRGSLCKPPCKAGTPKHCGTYFESSEHSLQSEYVCYKKSGVADKKKPLFDTMSKNQLYTLRV